MKMVIAYIQPFMIDGVEAALRRVDGLTGATFVDARGNLGFLCCLHICCSFCRK